MNFQSETFKILSEYNQWTKENKLLKDLDIVASLTEKDKGNLNILKEKIKKFCKENTKEKNKQLFCFFAELMTYDELRKRNFRDIKFLSEVKCQPDLEAKKEEKDVFIEVKRKGWSRLEEEAVGSGKLYENDGSNKQGLKKSVEDFVKDALKKFENLGVKEIQQRILVIDFRPGDGTQFEAKQPTLAHVLGPNYFEDLKKSQQITIWTSNYFSKYDNLI